MCPKGNMLGMQLSFVIIFMFLIILNTLMHNNTHLFYLILYGDDDKYKCVSRGCVSQSLNYGFWRGFKAMMIGSPVTQDHSANLPLTMVCGGGVALRCIVLRCVLYQATGSSTHSILLVHLVSIHACTSQPRRRGTALEEPILPKWVQVVYGFLGVRAIGLLGV